MPNWIASATEHAHGQFKKKAEAAGMSTVEFARKHEHAAGKLGEQARLALTLMGLRRKSDDQADKLYPRKD